MAKVLLGIPMLGTVTAEFLKSLVTIQSVNEMQLGLEVNSMTYTARNRLAGKALDSGYDYLVMVDSDMTFPPDAINKLVKDCEDGRDMVCALFFQRVYPTKPVILNSLTWERNDITGEIKHEAIFYKDYPKNSIFEVNGCGFGMVCIKCDVIKEIAERFMMPPFDPIPLLTEDFSFCWRMKQLGKKMYCDSNISIGHIGTVEFNEKVWDGQKK